MDSPSGRANIRDTAIFEKRFAGPCGRTTWNTQIEWHRYGDKAKTDAGRRLPPCARLSPDRLNVSIAPYVRVFGDQRDVSHHCSGHDDPVGGVFAKPAGQTRTEGCDRRSHSMEVEVGQVREALEPVPHVAFQLDSPSPCKPHAHLARYSVKTAGQRVAATATGARASAAVAVRSLKNRAWPITASSATSENTTSPD